MAAIGAIGGVAAAMSAAVSGGKSLSAARCASPHGAPSLPEEIVGQDKIIKAKPYYRRRPREASGAAAAIGAVAGAAAAVGAAEGAVALAESA